MAHFTVIGLGRFGITASLELIHMGHSVTGVDCSEKIATQYAEELTQTVICDSTDERALKELSLSESEAVLVAIGEDMEASLLTTLHLKNLGVKHLWVKANNAAHHTILSKLGVSKIIHPEEEMGIRVAQALNYPMVSDYIAIGHGYYVVEIEVIERIDNMSLGELLNDKIHIIESLLVKREQDLFPKPNDKFILHSGDILLLCGTRAVLKSLAPRLV
ncbi:potassium channel family protein [Pseudoalteromonas lipolytica]|uniref:Trk system potassium uptake protein TrkA n=1 Tax=Pseudoalteromonas lipolytica TaxID=570156 RepID=A0ABY1GT08_9GAMM|nr:TrkA family potassium uptake protein [Pseudoalteromonas lipolytica]MBE0351787.1 trk system potassium uptake protein TrkA [Pseudoalteromonas lipolytica LMEB 39]SFT99750.1 trk system potassium uptake protein TrkA [Pseudoalteromonas lipolytica]